MLQNLWTAMRKLHNDRANSVIKLFFGDDKLETQANTDNCSHAI